MYDLEKAQLAFELRRTQKVCLELMHMLKRDATLYVRLKRRTRRYLDKLSQLDKEAEEAQDKILRTVRLKRNALAKLTRKEREVLGLDYEHEEENPEYND